MVRFGLVVYGFVGVFGVGVAGPGGEVGVLAVQFF